MAEKKHNTRRGGKVKDLTGQRFGRLVATADCEMRGHRTFWRCICDCGNSSWIWRMSLTGGKTKSCGCLMREFAATANKTHGRTGTQAHRAWKSIKARCYNTNNSCYHNYGGRGIVVCKRWRNSFENFYADMGNPPGPGYSIDRIDNNGPYSPENCRWATQKEQMRNTRSTVFITFKGKTQCLTAWAEDTGRSVQSLYNNIFYRGWSIERALTEPAKHNAERAWNFRDMTGKVYGKLSVLAFAEIRTIPSGKTRTYWFCLCDCGREKKIWQGALTSGNTRSCGVCVRKEAAYKGHETRKKKT